MTFGEIEELTRYEICDETGINPEDFRVKPAQMLAYANEAELEACIRARLLRDSSTPAICQIAVSSGISVYDYDPRIILILRGRMTGAIEPFARVSHTMMDRRLPGWQERCGEPQAFVTGMDTGKIRFDRIPSAAGTLNLSVSRGPLTPMKATKDSPEIHSRLHPALIFWIKHKVYNNQDSELFDKNRSDIHLAAFEQKFGKSPTDPYDVFAAMEFTDYVPGSEFYGEDYY
jgi:hypothetical protein